MQTVLTMCRCFWYNGDRQAMATKYNIEDPYSGCTACMLFMCGCGGCLLCQEYNTMKKFQASGVQPFANNTVVITSPPAAIGVPVVAGGQAPHY
ncbi:hypothetical protein EON66_11565 [archaeon]|nr:MAG: hypothetical protein EON66_11565 [archaeon]